MYGIRSVHLCSQKARRFSPELRPEFGTDLTSPSKGLLRKVLVVDDERDLADMTAALLDAHGLDVLVAYSARDALILLQDHKDIDAVFSDVIMPGMTGAELAKLIDEIYPSIKVVLASGYALPGLISDFQNSYLYTSKPYTIDTVLKLLHS